MRSTSNQSIIIAAIITMIVSLSLWLGGLSGWLAYLASINIVCFGFYGEDKWRAIKQKSRTPEGTLHLMALTGGVLGARLGQKVFRHKTLKGSFQRVFWFIVFLQAMVVLAWYYLKYQWPYHQKNRDLNLSECHGFGKPFALFIY